jgi:molybdopterin synthase catalytic subunit
MRTTIRLQREPFDVAAEVERMTHHQTDIGAVVTFTGLCRADENGKPIAALTLEHYPGMAEAEIGRHVDEAYARWPLLGVTVIHRFGRLEPGDVIVLVATASSHREAAFAAASFLMDYLKTRAPFWKQVESVGDKTGGYKIGGERTCVDKTWVEAKASDDTAAERWSAPLPRHEVAK